MYLYRVINKDRYDNGILDNGKCGDGVNSFEYDDEEYLHFFVLPESADVYKLLRFTNNEEESVVTRWDVPYSLIENNYGVGIYRWFHPRIRHPFLEVRINKKFLTKDMLVGASEELLEEWKNKGLYDRYLNDIGVLRDDFGFNKISGNSYNICNYFPIKDLIKEGLSNEYGNDDGPVVVEKRENKEKKFKLFKFRK